MSSPGLLFDLYAFFQGQKRCGMLNGGGDDGRVWMSCDCCGAVLSRLLRA